MPTNAQILALAPGASYLAANDVRKRGLFNNFARLNPLLPQQIYAIYFIANKIYTLNPNYSGMTAVCLYLWEIMGRYGIAAQGLSGGGGSVSPITPPSASARKLEFTVTNSSIIPAGGNTYTFNTLPYNYIGYDLNFYVGGVLQPQINNGNAYYNWNSTTGIFQCFPNVQLDDDLTFVPIS